MVWRVARVCGVNFSVHHRGANNIKYFSSKSHLQVMSSSSQKMADSIVCIEKSFDMTDYLGGKNCE